MLFKLLVSDTNINKKNKCEVKHIHVYRVSERERERMMKECGKLKKKSD
jgi:hypothetical protein